MHRRRRIGRQSVNIPPMPSVPGYTHTPGHHCGSTALRNLLGFHGVEISEEMAFGLGAGACFYYVALDGRLAEPLVQRPHRAAGGELPRADRRGAGAAHLRRGRRRRPGRRRGPRSTPATRRCCSPTSTTSTTTATRPTSPATRWSSPATTSEFAHLSDTGFEELQTTPAWRTSTGPATAATPPTRSPATCSPSPARSTSEQLRGGDPGGDRAGGAGDGRARVRRVLRPRRGRAPGRRGRLLARGGRGLAVVRPLRLPGDRAPRHRRRRLPADVLALPRGGGPRRGAAGGRGGGALDRAGRAPSTRPARATSPSRGSGARSTPPPSASPRPSGASGRLSETRPRSACAADCFGLPIQPGVISAP